MLKLYTAKITDTTSHLVVVAAPNSNSTKDGGETSLAAQLHKVEKIRKLCDSRMV
jgi:hypothetical protein